MTDGNSEGVRSSRAARRLAAAVLAVQATALIGFCVYYLVRLIRHEGANAARIVMSVALLLIVAALLALLARGMAAGRGWARTPTVLWQALLLPVAFGMFQSERPDLGASVLALAVAGIAGVLLSGSDTAADGTPADDRVAGAETGSDTTG